jgi:PAS domain S-box-containing protein
MHAQKSKIIIAAGFAALIIFMIGVTIAGLSRMVSINQQIDALNKEQHIKATLSYTMRLAARERMISLILITNIADPFEKDDEMLRFNTLGTRFANARIKLLSLPLTNDEKSLLVKQSQFTAAVRPLQEKLIDLAFFGESDLAHKLLVEQAIPEQDKVITTLEELHDIQEIGYNHALSTTVLTYREAYILFMAFLGVIISIVGGIVAFLVIKKISSIESVLFKEKERYALAVRGANDGLWDWDLVTNQIYFSPRWKAMLGYEDHEIGNKLEEWIKRIHPDDSEKTMAALTAHLNGHTYYYESEQRLLHKDGSYRYFSIRGLAMRDEAGKSYRIAGSQADITERKLIEKQSAQNETRVNAVLNNVFEAIITIDQNSKIETFNQAAEKMFECKSEDVLDSKFSDLLPDPYRKDFEQRIDEYLEEEKSTFIGTNHEVMGQRKRGTAFPIELVVSEMWLGEERKFIIIANDISELKNKLSA